MAKEMRGIFYSLFMKRAVLHEVRPYTRRNKDTSWGDVMLRVQAPPPWGYPRSRADGIGVRSGRRGRYGRGFGRGSREFAGGSGA